jgi:hypothetical protein
MAAGVLLFDCAKFAISSGPAMDVGKAGCEFDADGIAWWTKLGAMDVNGIPASALPEAGLSNIPGADCLDVIIPGLVILCCCSSL